MNEYPSRSDLQPVDRSVRRALSPVQSIQPVGANSTSSAPGRNAATARDPAPQGDAAKLDDTVAGAAEYVKIHTQIAGILADLRSTDGSSTIDTAAAEIQSLMPVPIILVPLPPASKEAVEHVAVIARRMVEQMAYAHAAQAPLNRGTVEQVLATA